MPLDGKFGWVVVEPAPVVDVAAGRDVDDVVTEWAGEGDEEQAASTRAERTSAAIPPVILLAAPCTRSVWRTLFLCRRDVLGDAGI